MAGLTPYARLGDRPVLIFLLGVLIVGWLVTFRKLTHWCSKCWVGQYQLNLCLCYALCSPS
jgi:hypothetical protein